MASAEAKEILGFNLIEVKDMDEAIRIVSSSLGAHWLCGDSSGKILSPFAGGSAPHLPLTHPSGSASRVPGHGRARLVLAFPWR